MMPSRLRRLLRTCACLRASSLALIAIAAVLAGCDDETTAPTLARTFTPEPGGSGPAVVAQPRDVRAQLLVLDLVGRELESVYGVAFRLEYDGAVMRSTDMTASDRWSSDALALAQEPRPGLLVAGLSEKGDVRGFDAAHALLATLTFELPGAAGTPVSFVDGHCAVVAEDGAEVDGVRWVGGTLGPR
jgi:hypothetical protein